MVGGWIQALAIEVCYHVGKFLIGYPFYGALEIPVFKIPLVVSYPILFSPGLMGGLAFIE